MRHTWHWEPAGVRSISSISSTTTIHTFTTAHLGRSYSASGTPLENLTSPVSIAWFIVPCSAWPGPYGFASDQLAAEASGACWALQRLFRFVDPVPQRQTRSMVASTSPAPCHPSGYFTSGSLVSRRLKWGFRGLGLLSRSCMTRDRSQVCSLKEARDVEGFPLYDQKLDGQSNEVSMVYR